MGISHFYVTDSGAALLAQAAASGDITFTRGAVGKGYLAANLDESAQTALIDSVCDMSVGSATVANGIISVTTQFTNASGNSFLTEFPLAELALFGKIGSTGTETLIAYANARDAAHADIIPGDSLREFTFTFQLALTGADEMTITVGSSVVYANATHTHPTTDITGLDTATAGKADKVASAAAGHLAALDANGNLTDSGKAPEDFATPMLHELCRFTASGTFNPADHPTKDNKYNVFLVGGGQGGNVQNSAEVYTGGAGGYCRALEDVTVSASVSCTIGAGGYGQRISGVSSNDHTRSNGGTTSFGEYNAPGGGGTTETGVTYTNLNPWDNRNYGGKGGSVYGVLLDVSPDTGIVVGQVGEYGGYGQVGAGGNAPIAIKQNYGSTLTNFINSGGTGGIGGGGGGSGSVIGGVVSSYNAYGGAGGDGLIIIYGVSTEVEA